MQLALTSWPHWGAVEGCPLKHIANLGSRHCVLGTFPAASTMHLSTAAPRGMVQGSMTRGSRAALTISRLTSVQPWPREYRSQVTWWKWKYASVKQSALLYTTATWLAASGMPLPWLAVTWDCLVGWAFPRDCPDADACLTPGFPSRTPSARNSALSFPGRQAPRAKRTCQCRRHAMEFKDSMLKASGTGSPNRSRNRTHKIFHTSSSEEWIWLQTSATVALSGANLPKSGSSGWGGEPGTTVDPPWDPCTPGHAPQTDPHEHSGGVALAEEQAQTGPCTASRSRRPEHTRADGSTGHGQPSSSASCPDTQTCSWDTGTYQSPPYPAHSDDGHQRTHLVAALTLLPRHEGQHQGPLPEILTQAAEAHPETRAQQTDPWAPQRAPATGSPHSEPSPIAETSHQEKSPGRAGPPAQSPAKEETDSALLQWACPPVTQANPPPVAKETMAGQRKPQEEAPLRHHPPSWPPPLNPPWE